MRQKILVFGSNSFSGSDFIDLLLTNRHYQVIGISRSKEKNSTFLPYKRHKKPNFHFYQLDLNYDSKTIIALIDKLKPQFIVNFAAQSEVAPSWDHPEQWFTTNIVSLARLCNHLRKVRYLKRFLQISSPEVYGSCSTKLTEAAPVNPSTPYAASKAAADLFLFTLVKNYQFPAVFVRSTNVYGAHQQLHKIIPRTVISVKLDKTVKLHGGGKAVKSYIHVRDVSRGELAVLEKGKSAEIYHLSADKGISIKEVVKIICEKMKVPFTKVCQTEAERLGQDAAYLIDSTKARREFGWLPKIPFAKGIDGVIDWIEKDWQEIKKMPLEYIHKP